MNWALRCGADSRLELPDPSSSSRKGWDTSGCDAPRAERRPGGVGMGMGE